MGILDDLKQEAGHARLEKEQEEARQAELERIYRNGIRPAMMKIHHYLLELIEQLQQVKWTVKTQFEFPGIGVVHRLEQKGYNISIDSQTNPKTIVLRFECVSPDEKKYSVSPKSAADEACQFLLTQKVSFSDWAIRDANRQTTGTVIQARLRVWASLVFQADLENKGVRVTSYQFESPAAKSFLAVYHHIDEEWLDQLGHYILRKNVSFGKLDISEAERERIRLRVAEESRRLESQDGDFLHTPATEDGLLPKLLKVFTRRVL